MYGELTSNMIWWSSMGYSPWYNSPTKSEIFGMVKSHGKSHGSKRSKAAIVKFLEDAIQKADDERGAAGRGDGKFEMWKVGNVWCIRHYKNVTIYLYYIYIHYKCMFIRLYTYIPYCNGIERNTHTHTDVDCTCWWRW